MQNKETNKKTWIKYEQGQYVTYAWVPVKEGEAAKETEKVLKGIASPYWPKRARIHRCSPGGYESRKSA